MTWLFKLYFFVQVIMSKNNKIKSKEYEKRRKQLQQQKKQKSVKSKHSEISQTVDQSDTSASVDGAITDNKVCEKSDKFCQVEFENDNSKCDKQSVNNSLTESELDQSSTGTISSIKSPFHNSCGSSRNFKVSIQSNRSFSFERAEATDPLLVRWEEYKMLQTRLAKIKRLTF